MIQKHDYKGLTWIDLESPSEAEVREVMETFSLHPLVAEELLRPTLKPKVELHKGYMYLILHFPTLKRGSRLDSTKEIDFVIGKNFIITSRFSAVEPLLNFSKIFEVNSILGKEGNDEHAGHIFYYIVKKMYQHIIREVEHVRDKLCEVENKIFEGKEKEMVVELSRYSRELLDFKQIILTHKETLQSFEKHAEGIFGKAFAPYVNTIHGEFNKAYNEILSGKEFLSDLRETNDSLLSTKQNETMKVLTMMAFVTFPLSLITDMFSMNTAHAPIIGHMYDFEIIVVIMIVAALIMFAIFKYKKWL